MGFSNGGENAIEFMTGGDRATVTFSRQKYITMIRKLKERFPDKVDIIADGEKNSGYIYAHIPVEWIKIRPNREVSETQRERARLMGLQRATNQDCDEFEEIDEDEYISSSDEKQDEIGEKNNVSR